MVLDLDGSLIEIHSENKEGTAANFKHGFGFHPLFCLADATGEALGVMLRPGNATKCAPRRSGERHQPSGQKGPRHGHASDRCCSHIHWHDPVSGDHTRSSRPLVTRRIGQHHVMWSLREGHPGTDQGETHTQDE